MKIHRKLIGKTIVVHNLKEFDSAAQLSKRLGSLMNCLWEHSLKDFLGLIARVGYHILVPDFYLVLHGL